MWKILKNVMYLALALGLIFLAHGRFIQGNNLHAAIDLLLGIFMVFQIKIK
jgi:hypothetical protein